MGKSTCIMRLGTGFDAQGAWRTLRVTCIKEFYEKSNRIRFHIESQCKAVQHDE